MARFFGTVQGGRGQATRLGHSGLHVTAQSHSGSIVIDLDRDGDEDVCTIGVAEGSRGRPDYIMYRGPIKKLFDDQTNLGR